ncbi:Phospholipase C [Melia azedarach]|uniref:Phospholipase C n=1 Tax=Melia azedarach TaxID=155640 RepID=A0ACC1YPV7_MELAZ|nr:Phospholipase C [Melia azedarach]
MGGGFSYFRQSSSPQKLPKDDPDVENAGLATSIMKFMKPKCLWIDEEKDQMQMQLQLYLHEKHQQQINMTKERTLEEWLLASPRLNKNYRNGGGEYYVLQCLSSPKVHVHSSLYGDKADYISNNSRERLIKVDQVEQEEPSRGKRGKIKKRVSFRLPEETDIFIFYSPKKKPVE